MIPRGVLGTLYYSANSGRCIQFNIFRTTVASSWEERYEYRNPVYLYTGMYYACSTIADFLSQILSTHLISRNQKFADTNARSTKYSNNVYYTTLKMKAIDLSQRQLYGTEKVADTNNYQQYGFYNTYAICIKRSCYAIIFLSILYILPYSCWYRWKPIFF